MEIKAIIFDMDGTVINSTHVLRLTLKQCFNPEQYLKLLEYFDEIKGMSDIDAMSAIKKHLNLNSPTDKLKEKLEKYYVQNLQKGLEFVDGFLDFHKYIALNNIKNCIATNESWPLIKEISKNLGLDRLFGKNIYSVDDVGGISKPDPTLFLHSLKQLGCNKEECLVFEDSPTGIKAAKSAGIRVVAIGNSSDHSKLQDADYVIKNYCNLTLPDLSKKLL